MSGLRISRDTPAADFTGMRVLLVGERREEQLARVLARDGHDVLSVDEPEATRLGGVFAPDVIVFVGASCRELRRAVPAAGIIALVRGQDVEERISAFSRRGRLLGLAVERRGAPGACASDGTQARSRVAILPGQLRARPSKVGMPYTCSTLGRSRRSLRLNGSHL